MPAYSILSSTADVHCPSLTAHLDASFSTSRSTPSVHAVPPEDGARLHHFDGVVYPLRCVPVYPFRRVSIPLSLSLVVHHPFTLSPFHQHPRTSYPPQSVPSLPIGTFPSTQCLSLLPYLSPIQPFHPPPSTQYLSHPAPLTLRTSHPPSPSLPFSPSTLPPTPTGHQSDPSLLYFSPPASTKP